MARDACEDDLTVSPFGETGCEFVVFDIFVCGLVDLEAGAAREDGRHGFGNRRLFRNTQDFHAAPTATAAAATAAA